MITVVGEFNMMVDNVLVDILKGTKGTFVKSNELLFVLEPEMRNAQVNACRWWWTGVPFSFIPVLLLSFLVVVFV